MKIENYGNYSNTPLTRDIVEGDILIFVEAVFAGTYRSPKYIGDRTILATVKKESYGADKGQHTFTLIVHDCIGTQANEILAKETIRRKGRNLYKECYTVGSIYTVEDRIKKADDKHERGNRVREMKRQEREYRLYSMFS